MNSSTCKMLLVPFLLILFNQTCNAKPVSFNVIELGAKPDGKTDSTKSFLSAWAGACMSETPALVYIPPGRFLIQRVYLGGKCRNNNILFRIDGVLVAPADFRVAGNADNWIDFHGVDGVTISGGILDGHGTGLWDCKLAGKNCPIGAAVSSLQIL